MSRFPILFASICIACLAGCKTPAQKAGQPEKEKKTAEQFQHPDDGDDAGFREFVGRLRKAVAEKNIRALSAMMTDDFGYSWEPGSDGYGCFKYWDENHLWPELERVVNTHFTPNGNYLTAPPEFVSNPNYTGFRAGIRREGKSFKFAYFVPSQDTPMAQPPMQGN